MLLPQLKATGVSILLVEQNFNFAQKIGDTVAVMDNGVVVHSGSMQALTEDAALQKSLAGAGHMKNSDFDWKPVALVPLLALAGIPPDRFGLDLAHADRGGPGHGPDHLRHRLRADAGVRPDGRAQLRPRSVHRARCLRGHHRAGLDVRLDPVGRTLAQPGGGVPGHADCDAGGRCRGAGVRALHRQAGLRSAPEADPDHHGRHDHRRRADQGDLGPAADRVAAARGHARRHSGRRRRHREVPHHRRDRRPGGVRCAGVDAEQDQDRPADPRRRAGPRDGRVARLPHPAPVHRGVRHGQRAWRAWAA